jgi:MFS family permease
MTFGGLGVAFWLLNLLTKVNIWAGIVIRAFLGIVMGGCSAIVPLYLTEIAPPEYAGFFGNLNQAGIVLGMIFFSVIAPSCDYMDLCYVGAAVASIMVIGGAFIEESPAKSEVSSNSKKESIWQKKYASGLIMGILMMFFQQFVGINAIITNLSELMNESGLDIDGNYQSAIANCAQLFSVFGGGLLLDKFGRKVMWYISNGFVVVFLLIYALNDKYGWSVVLPLVCIFLYELGFGFGLGPIPWFIVNELLPDSVRADGSTIISSSNWIFAFIVIFVWPQMEKGLGMFISLIIFMVIGIISFLFGIFFVKEPKKNEKGTESSSDKPEDL